MADLTLLNKTDVVDDLTSSDTNKPLSANQGKELNDNKQDKLPSVVNDRYLHTNSSTGALEWAEVSDDYLKLNGTTAMTGSLKVKSGLNSITTMAENDALTICGGQDTFSPSLSLYGRNRSSSAGQFSLIAKDTSSEKDLIGKPDGTLTWDGNNIVTEASGDSRYLKLSGGTMTGQIVTSYDDAFVKNSDSSVLAIYGGTNYSSGAGLVLRGKGNSNPGSFSLKTVTSAGAYGNQLAGKPDGTLTWGSNDISGNVQEIAITAISGLTCHAYKIGRIVFVQGDGYSSGGIGMSVCIVDNLPLPAYDRVPATFGYFNTFNRGTRLWVQQSGSVGKLMTDTEGIAADYYKFNFTYISAN